MQEINQDQGDAAASEHDDLDQTAPEVSKSPVPKVIKERTVLVRREMSHENAREVVLGRQQ